MLVVAFLQWWYGPGWRDAARVLSERLHNTYETFSVPILLRTMVAPWRRIITPSGGSLQQRSRAALDNAVSRAVGLAVRVLALIAAGLLLFVYSLLGGLLLILWPALPLLAPVLIVAGLV